MDINTLTIGQAKELAAMFGNATVPVPTPPSEGAHDRIPVVVCTEKRGVVFGYTTNQAARPIVLNDARMCLYWSADVGGVFGLADIGPTKDCKISAVAPSLTLEFITAVFAVEAKAEKAWVAAKTQGR